MNFVGTGRRLAQGDVGYAALSIGVSTAVLLAFLEVEAAGRGFDSQNRPKMLFEPHVLWRNLAGKLRDMAAAAGIAYAKWKRNYPADSYPRLAKAIDIAREQGFRSASYGLPQILGENFKAAGFASAEEMFTAMQQGEREQLLAMVTLLKSWGLAAHLTGKDFSKPDSWRTAVSRYNGKGYEANNYHVKAAAAFVKHDKGIDAETGAALPPKVVVPSGAVLLEPGMKGEAIRVLQADLQALGFKFTKGVDGRFGAETEANVRLFQAANQLTVDGKVGSKTSKAIATALAVMQEDLALPPPVWPGQEDTRSSGPPWAIIFAVVVIAAILGGFFVRF
ncbi:N-acetylmuramidase domain-containing protein [Devosia beringensis]|uniref:N-acetylmuramidase domain-containing protein n=1 Tax=Devosia beringensis TaxID=2657486 RepID=UPI00186B8426|nr:N-acetylmuramidase domain-containing protein [Devosia beringensis]